MSIQVKYIEGKFYTLDRGIMSRHPNFKDEAKILPQAKQQLLKAYCGSDGKPYCTCETPKSSQLEDPSNEGRVFC